MVSLRSTLKHGEELYLTCRPCCYHFSAREEGTFSDNGVENSVVTFPKDGSQFFVASIEILASVWGLKETFARTPERAVFEGGLSV